jgi:hypothetical protein
MNGAKRCVPHFKIEELPPSGGFWCVTMHAAAGFQAANNLERFVFGDREALKYNSDGSLDLYTQLPPAGTRTPTGCFPLHKAGSA